MIDLATEFFVRARLASLAKRAYEYTMRRGIYYTMFGTEDFAPDLFFDDMTSFSGSRLCERVQISDVIVEVGATESTGSEPAGYFLVCQEYENGQFYLKMVLDDGKPKMCQVVINVRDADKEKTLAFGVSAAITEAEEDDIRETISQAGFGGSLGRLSIGKFEEVVLLMMYGRAALAGEVTFEYVVGNLGEMLAM